MLLLPTGLYTAAGVSAVALTVLVIAILPHDAARTIFASAKLFSISRPKLETVTSVFSLLVLCTLIVIGLYGPRTPVNNLLPLAIWTVWWMGFVTVQALIGDAWRWINPWTGIYQILSPLWGGKAIFSMPDRLESWPGVVVFLAFSCFMLADPAPDDPSRLATIVAIYALLTFAGMVLFGSEQWLTRCECFTIVLRRYADLAIFARRERRLCIGAPCWRLLETSAVSLSGAVIVLLVLGTGSFDGLNETFWWLGKLGINPLEFPGRSAVIWPTTIGLVAANALLVALFAAVVRLGLTLARADIEFGKAFGLFSLAILPIALGYHIAHYLTAFIVQIQYSVAALTDPWDTGADLLGLGEFYVTTGFFNSRDTVEIIWLSQAGAVVIGHVLSILSGHALATRLFGDARKAFLSQLPLSAFMIAYTLFGLWLLATPRGA